MASVTFKRGTRAEIEATAKQDGQILMETDQNKKNKMYIDLPDGSRVLIGNSGEAIDTSYDNTTSGLDATNVQNAIDKIENNVGDISGITDSLTATSSNIALSAAGGNNLQGQIDTLNSSLTYVTNKNFMFPVCSYPYSDTYVNSIVAIFPPYIMRNYTIKCNSVNIIGVGTKSITSQNTWENGIEICCNDLADYKGYMARCSFTFTKK